MERVIDAVIDTLRNGGLKGVTLFWGDPMMYSSFDLPCVAVGPNTDTVEPRTTHKDVVTYDLYLWVVVSARDRDMTASNESPSSREAIRLVDGHYDEQGNLLTPGVRTILRGDITLGGRVKELVMSRTDYRNGILTNEAVRVARTSLTVKQFITR